MAKKDLPTPEMLRNLLRYEPETGKLFWRERPVEMFNEGHRQKNACSIWNSKYSDKEAFTSNSKGYLVGAVNYQNMLAHRVIWAICYGHWPEKQIDHINGCRSDNRLSNLRIVSNADNSKNMKKSSCNTSGQTGVSWNKNAQKWSAYIWTNYKKKHLGLFNNYIDAVKARKMAERTHGYHQNHGR